MRQPVITPDLPELIADQTQCRDRTLKTLNGRLEHITPLVCDSCLWFVAARVGIS